MMTSQEEIKHKIQQYRQRLEDTPSSTLEEAEHNTGDFGHQWRHVYATLEAALTQAKTSPSTSQPSPAFMRRAQGLIYRATAWYVEHRVAEQQELIALVTQAMDTMAEDLRSLHKRVDAVQNSLQELQAARTQTDHPHNSRADAIQAHEAHEGQE
jgi:hypothetical protein